MPIKYPKNLFSEASAKKLSQIPAKSVQRGPGAPPKTPLQTANLKASEAKRQSLTDGIKRLKAAPDGYKKESARRESAASMQRASINRGIKSIKNEGRL